MRLRIPLVIFDYYPEVVLDVLADKIIVRAETSFIDNSVVYELYSAELKPVHVAEEPPLKTVKYVITDNGIDWNIE